MSLADLERRVRRDLDLVAHPAMPWMEPRAAPDGGTALDVLIVGAGQCGIAAGFGLLRSRIDNILAIDGAPAGREGPWTTYARMHTLRNPKDYTGPDLDIPSLTCRSWYEARFGEAAWTALDMVPREIWAEYLLWVRRMTGVPVANETRLDALEPAGGLLAAHVTEADGRRRTLHARKVVLATGQESMGRWAMPDWMEALPAERRARAADPIDFAALKGKRVVVVGAGASAFDNAASALEARAAGVHLLCRRLEPQVIQPYRWLSFRGFMRHFCDLDDEWRWRFMSRVLGLREGFTQQTYDRCMRHEAFAILSGSPVQAAHMAGGAVRLETGAGVIAADFVIAATGMEIDFARRGELAGFADNIATWADRYTPPPEERDARLGGFPYLGPDYALTEKTAGLTPWMADIHVFSIASTMSFGPSGSSINAMTTAVPKLVAGIGRGLFRADIERHWAAFSAYDVKQAELRPSQTYRVSESPGSTAAARAVA